MLIRSIAFKACRRPVERGSYLRIMKAKHQRHPRTDRHRRQVNPPRRVQAAADALVSLTLTLLRRHSIDELRAMQAAATGGEKELLRDVVLIAQYNRKEGH